MTNDAPPGRLEGLLPYGTYRDRDGCIVGIWMSAAPRRDPGDPVYLSGLVRSRPGGILEPLSLKRLPPDAGDPGDALLAAPRPESRLRGIRDGSMRGGDVDFAETFDRVLDATSGGALPTPLMARPIDRTRARGLLPDLDPLEVQGYCEGFRVAAEGFLAGLDANAVAWMRGARVGTHVHPLTWDGMDPDLDRGAPLARAIELAPLYDDLLGWAWRQDPEAFRPHGTARAVEGHLARTLVKLAEVPPRLIGCLPDAQSAWLRLPRDTRWEVSRKLLAMDEGDAPTYVIGALRLLDGLPGNWRPRSRAEWEVFLRVAPSVEWASAMSAEGDYAALVGAGDGWAALAERLRSASGKGLDGVVHALRDAYDPAAAFRDQVVRPAVLLARGESADARHDPRDPRSWHVAAFSMLFAGRGMPRILRMSGAWHARRDEMAAAIDDLGGGRSVSRWPAGLPEAVIDGISIVTLVSSAQLAHEGGGGDDPLGMAGLDHCVGGYSGRCASGLCRIVSMRRPLDEGGVERLSTAEVAIRQGRLVVVQHRGPGNCDPPREAVAVLEAYMGRLVAEPDSVGRELVPDHVDSGIAPIPFAEVCGYGWWIPGNWEAVRDLWSGFLPKPMRDMAPAEFVAAIGPGLSLGQQVWTRRRFEPSRTGPDTDPEVGDQARRCER